ncbi:MAG: hypothetical protein IJ017_06835 [Oscillospiraceae bacterium]|nr:hypothetical protein [Oscillospiraceae bacterium]
MATAESVKSKIQGLIDTANEATGGTDTDLTAAVKTLVAGFGQGGSGAFEVTEGTITPTSNTQTLRIPWDKDTLPLFYVCIRPDLDTYVTPDNPATTIILGGIVNFCCGYTRNSASVTTQNIALKFTATTDYTGYTASHSSFSYEILDAEGLLAYSNSASYKWSADTTYKYYIVDRAV